MAAISEREYPRAWRWERWAALGGIVYVVLFIVGLIVSENGQPDSDAAPAKVIAFYSKGSNRDQIGIGWLIMLVGFLGLILFIGVLAQVVRRLSDSDAWSRIAVIGGALYAGAGVIGASLSMAIKTMSDDTYRDQVDPELIHAASDGGYVIHSGGGVGAGAMMIAASAAALGARSLPAWVCWLGVLAGVVAVFSIFFFPWIVIAVWLVVVSVMLFVAEGRVPGRPAPES
jgi:uncharacterized membrane protein YhaH (DUF805 family)